MTTLTAAAANERIAEMHENHRGSLLRLLVRLTHGERQTAEDLVQETMLRAWRHLDSLPTEPDRERRWLYTVARHLVIDSVRSKKLRPVVTPVFDLDWVSTSPEAAEAAVATHSMLSAFHKLSAAHRQILTDLYIHGEEPSRVAERLGLPVGTVKSRAHYALKALRSGMAAAG